jgi:hypothetical protein
MTYLLKEKKAKGSSTLKHQKKGRRQSAKEGASRYEKKEHSRLQKLLLQKVRVVKSMGM